MKLVCFSAGTDSTAVLFDTINKYGIDQVMVLTTILLPFDNKFSNHYTVTDTLTRKICTMLGIKKHVVSYRSVLGAFNFGYFGQMYITPDAYLLTLSHPEIDDVFLGGHNQDDIGSPRELLCIKIFDSVMSAYNRKATYSFPLTHKSKRELWDMIPKEYQPLVWTCHYPVINKETLSPCGKCSKCLELMSLTNKKEVVLQGATGVC